MKKRQISKEVKKIFFVMLLFLVVALPVLAGVIEIRNPLRAETFEELIDSVINFIFYIGLALVPLMIIISAFYFFTAGGDPNQITTAKKFLFYTLIGLVIILLAKVLGDFIVAVLG